MPDLPDLLGLVGRALLAAGAALVAVGLVAVLPAVLRVRRRALALEAAVAEARGEILAGLALLAERRAETEVLLAPWRRLLRWARHPLVVATVQWYGRRRRARR